MVRLVLHIGVHKSATTSMQAAVKAACDARPSTAYVGRCELTRLIRKSAARGIVKPARIDKFLRRLDNKSKGRDFLFVSDENMLGMMPGLALQFYPHAPALRQIIDAIAKRFDTHILLQSRETVSFLRSCFAFRLGLGGRFDDYRQFLDAIDLDSISWLGLGQHLFAHSDTAYTVLPLEAVRDSTYLDAAIRGAFPEIVGAEPFVLPKTNPSISPMDIAVIVGARRAGFDIAPVALSGFERAFRTRRLADLPPDDDALDRLVRTAAKSAELDLSPHVIQSIVREARADTMAAMDAPLRDRFGEDYQRFIERFVHPPVTDSAIVSHAAGPA